MHIIIDYIMVALAW